MNEWAVGLDRDPLEYLAAEQLERALGVQQMDAEYHAHQTRVEH